MRLLLFALLTLFALPAGFLSAQSAFNHKYYRSALTESSSGVLQLSDGNFLIIGHTFLTDTEVDIFFQKVTPDGTRISLSGFNFGGNETAAGIIPSDDGFIFSANFNNRDILIGRFDANSNLVWVKTLDGGFIDRTTNRGLFPAENGGAYLCGMSAGCANTGCNNSFIAKIDRNGNLLWQKSVNVNNSNPGSNDEALAVFSDNNPASPLWVTGSADGQAFILSFNKSDGNLNVARILAEGSLNAGTVMPGGRMAVSGNYTDATGTVSALYMVLNSAGNPASSDFPALISSGSGLSSADIIFSPRNLSPALLTVRSDGLTRQTLIIRINDNGLLSSEPHLLFRGFNFSSQLLESSGGQWFISGVARDSVTNVDPADTDVAFNTAKADYSLRDVSSSCLIVPFRVVSVNRAPAFSAVSPILIAVNTNLNLTEVAGSPQGFSVNELSSCCSFRQPEINFPTDVICTGTRVPIDVSPENDPNFIHTLQFIDPDGEIANLGVTSDTAFIFSKAGTYTITRFSKDNVSGCEYPYDLLEINVRPGVEIIGLPGDTVLCAGQTMRFDVSSNVLGVTYRWSNPNLVQSATDPRTLFIGPPGIHTLVLRVTDPVSGCFAEKEITVTVNNAETDLIIKDNPVVCLGGTFRLNTVRPFDTYQWSPAQFLDNPSVRNPFVSGLTRPVTFKLRVTSADGCQGEDSVLVGFRRLISVPNRDTVICDGQTGGVRLSVAPDAPGLNCSYRWSTDFGVVGGSINSNTIIANPSRDTCYVVTATCPGGCTLRDTICVRLRVPLPVTPPEAVTVCRGSGQVLTVRGGLRYEWSPAAGVSDVNSRRPTVSPDRTTTYTVKVWDALGCTQNVNVTVTVDDLPFNDIVRDTVICRNNGIRLPAGPVRPDLIYFWEPQTGILPGQEDTPAPLLNPPVTTTYTVEINNTANGCIRVDTVTVRVIDRPTGRLAGPSVICAGNRAVLRVSGDGRFFWVNAPRPGFYDSVTVSPADDIEYLVVPSVGTCEGETLRLAVRVIAPPTARFTAPTTFCVNTPARVSYNFPVRPEDTPQWDFADGKAVPVSGGDPEWGPFNVSFDRPGVRRIGLRVRSSDCSDSLFQTVTVSETPSVSAGPDVNACQGQEVFLEGRVNYAGTAGCSYLWRPSVGLNNPTVLRPSVRISETTEYILFAVCGACTSAVDTVTVFMADAPVVFTDEAELTVCAGGVGIRLNTRLEPGLGIPPYFYQWTPVEGLDDPRSPAPIANPTRKTTYFLTVTDGNGCVSRPVFTTVNVNPIPIVDAGPDLFLCTGTLEGGYLKGRVSNRDRSGSYAYRWSPNVGLANADDPNTYASPIITTIYTLTVINKLTGCSSDSTTKDTSATVVVNVDNIPVADAGPPVTAICLGDSVRIGAVGTVTGPQYRYVWSPSTGLSDSTAPRPFAKPSVTTTYFFTVYSNGCRSVTDKITVEVKSFPVFNLESFGHICVGESYQTQITINNNKGPYTARWRPATGLSDTTALNPVASPVTTTTYYCTIFTEGCKDPFTDSVTVRVHPRPATSLNTSGRPLRVCPFGTDSLYLPYSLRMPPPFTDDPIYFEFQPTDGVGNSRSLNTGLKPKETTTYTVKFTTGKCTYEDTVTVFVLPFVETKITSRTGRNDVCMGETFTFDGSGGNGGATFLWRWKDRRGFSVEGNRDTFSLVPDVSGWLTLTASEGNCSDTDSFFIKVRTQPVIRFDYELKFGCDPLEVRFYSQTPFQADWTWDFGDGSPISNLQNPEHRYTQPGDYRVGLIVRSLEFCEETLKVERLIRVRPAGIAEFLSDPPAPVTLYLPNATVQFRDTSRRARNFYWEFGDGSFSTEKNPFHRYVTPGSYNVKLTITDSSGCRFTVFGGFYDVKLPEITIPNVFTPNNDGVNDVWDVIYQGSERITVQIVDRWGVEMYRFVHGESGWNGKLKNSESDAAEGTYFYLVKVGEKMFRGDVTLLR